VIHHLYGLLPQSFAKLLRYTAEGGVSEKEQSFEEKRDKGNCKCELKSDLDSPLVCIRGVILEVRCALRQGRRVIFFPIFANGDR